jgi:ribosomal protein S18 acetylase RimI-like enzyme
LPENPGNQKNDPFGYNAMEVNLSPAKKSDWISIKQLYREAFPRAERKPLWLIRKLLRQKKMEVLAVSKNGVFAGLAMTILHHDFVMLEYFAVLSHLRGHGIGGQAFDLLQKQHHGKKLILDVELLDENAPNQAQRIRRKEFYHRHGMKDTGLAVRIFGVAEEILSNGCAVTFADYQDIYRFIMGSRAERNIQLLYEAKSSD